MKTLINLSLQLMESLATSMKDAWLGRETNV